VPSAVNPAVIDADPDYQGTLAILILITENLNLPQRYLKLYPQLLRGLSGALLSPITEGFARMGPVVDGPSAFLRWRQLGGIVDCK